MKSCEIGEETGDCVQNSLVVAQRPQRALEGQPNHNICNYSLLSLLVALGKPLCITYSIMGQDHRC